MVLGAFVTYVSRSSCAAQPRTSRPFLRAGAHFGGVSSWSAVLCGCGGTGPRARAHVRVLSLYSQLLLLPHSNSSNTSRGRPGARHPPLRGDSATPGRLPAGLRRRLDHDTQARCSRPARAFCPGLLPSRSLPARLQRLAPAARQKKKSGSTPWVVGACGTRGGHRMSEWSR